MIDWSRVDTVLLDMDGTLLDLAFDNRFWMQRLPAEYARASGLATADAAQDLFARMAAIEGTIRWYCLDYWSTELGVDVLAITQRHRDEIAYRVGAIAFLQAIAASGRQRLLVTNAHRGVLSIKLDQTGLDGYLDDVVSAHDYGHAKQDQRFWDALAGAQGFDPARALLVDDSHAVLRAAQRWGIGQVVGVARPDSTGEVAPNGEFALIDRFDQVSPPGIGG